MRKYIPTVIAAGAAALMISVFLPHAPIQAALPLAAAAGGLIAVFRCAAAYRRERKAERR